MIVQGVHAATRPERIAAGQTIARNFMQALEDTERFGRTITHSAPTFTEWLRQEGQQLQSTEGELRGTLDRIFLGLCPSTATRRTQGRADAQIRQAAEAARHNADLRAAYLRAQDAGDVTVTVTRLPVNLNSHRDRALIRNTLRRERARTARLAAS